MTSQMETFQQQNGGGSLESDIVPPDRSSSSSAPPALQLATESLFAFRVEYAKIFSDIRTHEDYVSFYESNKERARNLPPPLDPSPFFDWTTNEEDEFARNRYFNGMASPQDNYPDLHQAAQQAFQQMNLGQSKNVDIWNPMPRIRKGPFNNSFSDLNYASSPSAQTALNTANFIWKDEDSNSYGQEPPKMDSHMGEPIGQQGFFNGNQKESFDDQLKQDGMDPSSPRSTVLCRYYASGYCSRGDKCFYSHDVNTATSQQPASPPQQSHQPQQPHVEVSSPAKQPIVAPVISEPKPAAKQTKSGKGNSRNNKSSNSSPASSSNHATPVPAASNTLAPSPNGKGGANHNRSRSREQLETTELVPSNPASPRGSTTTAAAAAATGEVNYTFDQLVGKIYLVSKDQQGCRFLQKKLEEQDPPSVEQIFNEVYDHITELMTDPFGNYLCQKLLEHCNDRQRFLVVERVAPDLVYISKNMHGTRAVQKMIECLSSSAQVNIIKEALRNSVVELIQDLNGNHVIQRCLNRLTPEDNQFIYDAVTSRNNCVEVATHRHGCCVLQRCIDHASNKQKVQLIQEITRNGLTLIQDAYGNYVVQYVLDLQFPELVDNLARTFFGNIRVLATQKFSSNVIEKCLGVTGVEVRNLMIKEILQEKAHFLQMLQDPFANYVIQTALTISEPQQHHELVESIKPFLNQLRNTPFGKRIQSKIAKETAERARDKR